MSLHFTECLVLFWIMIYDEKIEKIFRYKIKMPLRATITIIAIMRATIFTPSLRAAQFAFTDMRAL